MSKKKGGKITKSKEMILNDQKKISQRILVCKNNKKKFFFKEPRHLILHKTH